MKMTLKIAWKKRAKLWAECILRIHGNVTMEWQYRSGKFSYACIVDGKETFEPLN